MTGRDTNIGAKRARELRAALGLRGGTPVACILTAVERRLGVPVVLAALPDGIAGCCWRDGDRAVLWVNGRHAPVRQRFTLAHELGHLRCGHDAGLAVDTLATLADRTVDPREIQANAFAAELLAPAEGVRAALDREPTLEHVVAIAARYGISTIAALYRLSTLALTTRFDVLRGEIGEGLHEDVWRRLDPARVDDAIAAIEPSELPRLSPALARSALAALADGATSLEDAARAAACSTGRLATGAAIIGA
jgi:Zn-dependent peptidase ImmA (M78 family)